MTNHKIQQTSLFAFDEIKPLRSKKHIAIINVFKCISLGGLTNRELSKVLNWEINTVTPRVNELLEMGVLVDCGKRLCTYSGRMCRECKLK